MMVSEHFSTFGCRFVRRAQGILHLAKKWAKCEGSSFNYNHYTTLHYNYSYNYNCNYTTLNYTTLHYNYNYNHTTLHYTTLH